MPSSRSNSNVNNNYTDTVSQPSNGGILGSEIFGHL